VKIGPADPEIICLREIIKDEKTKEINASKIYSPVIRFAELAKKRKIGKKITGVRFLPREAMLSTVFAVVVCLCVRYTPVLYQNG